MGSISEFFDGKTILITGSTGFFGQPLVEKILWASPQVHRIYLLIRPKKLLHGIVLTPQERIEKELFQSTAFDRLYSRYGDKIRAFLEEKLVAVAGDLAHDDLGLDPQDKAVLQKDLDLVINSAAVVSFDAPVDEALEMNVFGAQRLARFARRCEKAVLCHVSTAYVCGATNAEIPETFHHSAYDSAKPFPLRGFRNIDDDIQRIREIAERVRQASVSDEVDRELKRALLPGKKPRRATRNRRRRDVLERLRRQWLREHLIEEGMKWARKRGWNDTYTYTKALGEQLVRREVGDMPTVIMRPSVIESSLSEPSPGWLDGLRMADPLIVAIGKGRLKRLPLNPDVVLDLVPVDVVVNATLAAIPKCADEGGLTIYQVATGSQNKVTLDDLADLIYDYFERNPMLDRVGDPIRLRRMRFQTPKQFRRRHKLRNASLESAEKTLGRFPRSDVTQKMKRKISSRRVAAEKLYYYGEIYEPYLNLDCRFQVDNTMRLHASLDEKEQRLFNFDVTRINWRYYIQNVHIPGVKKYILKMEGAGTLEVADPKQLEPLPEPTIPHLLARAAERFPQQVALQIRRAEGWQRVLYKELHESSLKIGRRFQEWGFRKGDRVVIYSENQPQWALAYMGAVQAGLVAVPIDAQTWHREAWSVARFTGARAILASEYCLKRLRKGGMDSNEAAENPIKLINIDRRCLPFEIEDFPRSTKLQPDPEAGNGEIEVRPDDLASIIFTSGTFANPRGAVHTHSNFINNLIGVNHYLPIHEDDQLLSVLPLYHALAFTCGLLMPIFGGATVTYENSLKPRVFLETMRETGTTCLLGVPTLLAMLRDDVERRVLRTSKSKVKSNIVATSKQLSRSVERRFGANIGKALFAKIHQEFGGKVRLVVSGGSALGGELYDDYNALGFSIYEGYGLTETAPVLTVSPLNRSRRNSAGKPLPGIELRLFHPDEEGVGEIIVQTPSLMQGYYKNPQATQKVVRDQWFHTGDLGWVDADGYVYITGRAKDVIVTGAGKNVYPIDLEAIYKELPVVRDICVAGVKSGLTEEVHAVIVPEEGVDEAKLRRTIQRLSRQLPSYHRLQAIHLSSGPFPRDENDRLVRPQVREWLAKKLEGRAQRDGAAASESQRESALLEELSRLSGLPSEEIRAESDLYTDLGLDSLNAIELLLFLENHYGLSLADRRAALMHTVGELLEELERQESGKGASPRSRSRTVRSSLPLEQRPVSDRMCLGITISGLRMFYRHYMDLQLHGAEVLSRHKPFIIAANHSSHLDFGAILAAFRSATDSRQAKQLHIVGARDYFFNSPVKSWFYSSFLNIVPIEREETSLGGLRMVRSILSTGEPVLIFPEGTRSLSGRLQSFKPGLGLMALELDVPIIPAYIHGTFQSMPKGKHFPRRGRVDIYFGQPILMNPYRGNGTRRFNDVYRQIAADVQQAVSHLAKEAAA